MKKLILLLFFIISCTSNDVKIVADSNFNDNEKVLDIGDNLRTDIKGANNLNKDSLLISDGVHRKEFSNEIELQKLLMNHKVKANYYQKELQW